MEKPRFLRKTVRGFNNTKGPRDVNNPSNYNQKLRNFMEDALDDCEDDPQKFPGQVENFFQENLLKRYNLIRYLKAEIRREKQKNEFKRKLIEDQKSKTEQRQLSKNLVTSFRDCIDQVLVERDRNTTYNTYKPGANPLPKAARSNLKEIEKRKILENFVENDEALGQLLDFISSHYIQSSGDPNAAMPDMASAMTGRLNHPYTATHSVSTLNTQHSHGRIN